MSGFIEELFFDNIRPQSKKYNSSQYINAMEIIEKNENLLPILIKDDNVRKIFLDYANAWSDLLGAVDVLRFTDGFRIGASFTYDTFVTEDLSEYLKD